MLITSGTSHMKPELRGTVELAELANSRYCKLQITFSQHLIEGRLILHTMLQSLHISACNVDVHYEDFLIKVSDR